MLKSGFAAKITSSLLLCCGGGGPPPYALPGPLLPLTDAGRQFGFTGLSEIDVKWLASEARSLPPPFGERAPSGRFSCEECEFGFETGPEAGSEGVIRFGSLAASLAGRPA